MPRVLDRVSRDTHTYNDACVGSYTAYMYGRTDDEHLRSSPFRTATSWFVDSGAYNLTFSALLECVHARSDIMWSHSVGSTMCKTSAAEIPDSSSVAGICICFPR